jgi:hypothetical protein
MCTFLISKKTLTAKPAIMKRVIIILSIALMLAGCAGRVYTYSVEMTHPVNSKQLFYENDTFSIAFQLLPKWIEFTIYNKSTDGIRINWDEVSFSVDGITHRIVHKETGTYKITDVQPPTTIPPKSNLKDFIISTDKLVVTQGSFNFVSLNVNEQFPDNDYGNKKKKEFILSYKGNRITIFMPYYVRGQYISQYYDLMIRDVAPKKNK